VRFYGLVDLTVLEVIEFYCTREKAEQSLADVVADEPDWVTILRIDEIDLGGPFSSN